MAETQFTAKADESVKTGALMPMVSLRKHFRISLYIFVAFALLGIPLAWVKGKSYYSATAVIRIAPRVANILLENREMEIPSYQQYKQFVEQQIDTITRYDILLESLDALGDKRHVWQADKESDRRAAERLQSSLAVKQVGDSYLVSISLESDKDEGLNDIVNTVAQTFIKRAHEDELIYASKERMDILYQQRDKLADKLHQQNKELSDLSQEMSVTVFVDNVPNRFDELLADSQSAYATAQRAHLEAVANALLFDNPNDPQASAALDAAVEDTVYKDPGLLSLKSNLFLRRSELVRQIGGLDPNHPGYVQIKGQLDRIEKEVVDATEQLTNKVRFKMLQERRSQVRLTEKIEQDLLTQINSQKQNAAWYSSRYNYALALKADIKLTEEKLQLVDNRVNFMELESKSPGFFRMETPARPPEMPVRGGRKKLLVMMTVLGAVIGLIVPILIDMFDRRIKTGGQVEKLLGYKPLALFLAPEHATGGLENFVANQRRHLSLALERERIEAGRGNSLILMTGVGYQNATTLQALELAADLNRIQVRAIVVEVNALRPDQRYANSAHPGGLLNLLSGADQDIAKLILPGENGLPDRIGLGAPSENLLGGYQRLQAALKKLAESYTVIILDAAPILFSADTEFFASICDITLMVIAAMQNKPPLVKRAVQVLERVNPKAVGFLVTRLEVFNGGGYYASLSQIYNKNDAVVSAVVK